MSGEAVLSVFDLRLRSLDRQKGEPICLCCTEGCDDYAEWSVWLHTPDYMPHGGATYVRCNRHALILLKLYADQAVRRSRPLVEASA